MSRFIFTSLIAALAAFFALSNESYATFISSNGTFTTLEDPGFASGSPGSSGLPLPDIRVISSLLKVGQSTPINGIPQTVHLGRGADSYRLDSGYFDCN